MSDRYVCTLTAALQAMIPGAIKGKREKALSLGDDARLFLQGADGGTDELTLSPDRLLEDPQTRSLLAYVQRNEPLPAPKLLQAFPQEARLIKEALQHGWLQETERIKDRIGVKRLKRVTLTVDDVGEAVDRLGSRAGRQQETLRLLEEYGGELPLKSLNASAVKALEGKGYVAIDEVEVMRDPYAQRRFRPSKPLPLTEEQQQVFEALALAVDEQEHQTFLLHGVTGSGKTEVYLQAIERCLDSGREAIVLVPEISLTPQMVERFKGDSAPVVAVMHSRLSQGERYDEWRKSVKAAYRSRSEPAQRCLPLFPGLALLLWMKSMRHPTSRKRRRNITPATWRLNGHAGKALSSSSDRPRLRWRRITPHV